MLEALSRRRFLKLGAAATGSVVLLGNSSGCATSSAAMGWQADEQARLARDERPGAPLDVVVRGAPDAAVLRRRAREVPAGADLRALAGRMEASMREAKGVGLAAPQVGLSIRAAVLMLGFRGDNPEVVFTINPRILERSDETEKRYEGCLSIPGVGGLVRRNEWVRVGYQSPEGVLSGDPAEIVVEARGWDAVLWQHELDHLEGALYTDRLLGELLPSEEMRKRRKEMEEKDPDGVSARGALLLGGAGVSGRNASTRGASQAKRLFA